MDRSCKARPKYLKGNDAKPLTTGPWKCWEEVWPFTELRSFSHWGMSCVTISCGLKTSCALQERRQAHSSPWAETEAWRSSQNAQACTSILELTDLNHSQALSIRWCKQGAVSGESRFKLLVDLFARSAWSSGDVAEVNPHPHCSRTLVMQLALSHSPLGRDLSKLWTPTLDLEG